MYLRLGYRYQFQPLWIRQMPQWLRWVGHRPCCKSHLGRFVRFRNMRSTKSIFWWGRIVTRLYWRHVPVPTELCCVWWKLLLLTGLCYLEQKLGLWKLARGIVILMVWLDRIILVCFCCLSCLLWFSIISSTALIMHGKAYFRSLSDNFHCMAAKTHF